jgi:peroxiredoxin
MKFKTLTLIFLFLSVTAFSQNEVNRGYHVKVGEQAPNLTLHFVNGKTATLNQLRGKVVVLQFTASWCPVCRREMPHLEKEIWDVYKNKNFLLVAVDFQQPADTAAAFKKEMKITYPMADDKTGNQFFKFAVKNAGVTRNIVIDQHGKIAFLTRLYNREEFLAMKKKIGELLK